MAISKDALVTAALNAASDLTNVQQFIRARDPRVLQQIEAQATMLAMLSEQLDVAKFEPFTKSRDATVLADAALKGILPLGRACKVTLLFANTGGADIALTAQRRVVDAKGRLYELDAAIAIPAGESRSQTATQVRRRSVTTPVTNTTDFYQLPVPLSSDEMFLNTLVVYKGATEFNYAPDWFNVAPGELAYQVQVDEMRRMSVTFGKDTVVGYGVKQGDQFTLDITECNGRISDQVPGSQFVLEQIADGFESSLKCSLQSVQDEGAAPHSIAELRFMAQYPAIYDHNAVYRGNFEYLLRRYISGIRFLSVWNEQIEEAARGASVNNINCLFVAGLVNGMVTQVFRDRVLALIKRADDSYRVRFVDASLQAVTVTVTASVAINWDRATVEAQIRALLLERFGDGAVGVSKGMDQPIKKAQINKLLREQIAALRDERAEFDVDVVLPVTPLPEHFLFISPASLTVAVSSVEYGGSLWNH